VNYQCDQENLEKDKGDITYQVNENVMGISKNQVMNHIDQCG